MWFGTRFDHKEQVVVSTGAESGVKSRRDNVWVLVGICLLTVLAFTVRVWHLDQQSVWLDELLSNLGYLNAPAPWTFFDLIRFNSAPESVPVYYWFEYVWEHLAGSDPWVLRLAPVMAGAACVPLIYAVGARFRGPWAGGAAALCLALSPSQIYWSQELLPYSFIMPLALLSVLGLLRGLQDNDAKGWLLMLAANALLLWTHVTSVAFVLAEMAFLCVGLYGAGPKRWGWMAAQAASLLSWGWYVTHLSRRGGGSYEGSLMHGLATILMFRDMSVELNYSAYLAPDSLPYLASWLPLMNRIMACVAGAAFVWLAAYWLWRCLRLWITRAPDHKETLQTHTLVAFLIVCPLSLLLVLALAGKGSAVLLPRYSLCLALPIYLAIGGMLAALPGRRLKTAALAGLAALYGYQAAILMPTSTRADSQGAARYISQKLQPDDVVMTCPSPLHAMVPVYALRNANIPILLYATSSSMLINAANYLLADAGPGSGHPQRTVWIFLTPYESKGRFSGLERQFAACGMEVLPKVYNGGINVAVWRVQRGVAAFVPTPPAAQNPQTEKQFRAVLAELGVPETDARTRRLLALGIQERVGFPNMYGDLLIAYDLLLANQTDLAERAAERSVKSDGRFEMGHVAKALVSLRRGDIGAANRSFQDALGCSAYAGRILREFAEASCDAGGRGSADAIEHLESAGVWSAIPWREINRLIVPGGSRVWPPGLYPLRAKDYDRLAPEFASLNIPESLPAEAVARIGELFEVENRIEEAKDAYRKANLQDPANLRAQAGLAACAEPVSVNFAAPAAQ